MFELFFNEANEPMWYDPEKNVILNFLSDEEVPFDFEIRVWHLWDPIFAN